MTALTREPGTARSLTETELLAGYVTERELAAALLAGVEERVADLRGYLRWYRTHAGWIVAERVDTIRELRYLLRLRRAAKRRVNARPAWQDGASAYHDWQADR